VVQTQNHLLDLVASPAIPADGQESVPTISRIRRNEVAARYTSVELDTIVFGLDHSSVAITSAARRVQVRLMVTAGAT
jgi:hypothetical protein